MRWMRCSSYPKGTETLHFGACVKPRPPLTRHAMCACSPKSIGIHCPTMLAYAKGSIGAMLAPKAATTLSPICTQNVPAVRIQNASPAL
eukprot:scaffold35532_cov19-Tisochrysis_lutea.AAC.2